MSDAGPVRAYIGLGSNLDDPLRQVRSALAELAALPESALVARSSLYRSAPMGPPEQPDYVNAVAVLDTRLEPLPLLEALQSLEAAHGRVRGPQRWGPRSLDLDLLLYGTQRLHDPRLSVPHPGLPERNFVLYPLSEVAPDLQVPGYGPLRDLLARCSAAGLRRLDAQ